MRGILRCRDGLAPNAFAIGYQGHAIALDGFQMLTARNNADKSAARLNEACCQMPANCACALNADPHHLLLFDREADLLRAGNACLKA